MKFKPHEYQKKAIDFIIEHKAAGLFLDMGLGKTAITLTAIDRLMYDYCEVERVLVIAPLRVAEDTWSRESQKWDHLRHLRISKILGTADERARGVEADADIYVINRENVVWLTEYLTAHKLGWPYDMVVIDELSSFKSSQAKRFKALRKARPFMKRIVGLTGTPAANGLLDLWAEMYLLDRGERLGPSLTRYRYDYFRPGATNGQVVYNWVPKKDSMEVITKRISDITMSMSADDYLSLPNRIDSTIAVKLSDEVLQQYKDMERDCILSLGDDEEIAATSAAAAMNKLLQMANGFVYDEWHEQKCIHGAKISALDEIIEAADGPVLVFYEYQADRDKLMALFNARQLKSDEDIAEWNRGNVPVMVAHPASVGYGLNLQDGGHIIVWYGMPWSLELYTQANARLHRQGQEKPVLVYHLVSEGTVDEDVMRALARKDTSQRALLGALKERL